MAQLLLTRLTLAATSTAPSCARALVRCTLTSWLLGDLVEAAELIVTELATNAVQATGTTDPCPTYADLEHLAILAVQVRVTGDSLLIEVWDADEDKAAEPPPMEAGFVEGDIPERGRGLAIVRALSRRHGVRTLATGGKIVWAEMDAGPRIAAVPQIQPIPGHALL